MDTDTQRLNMREALIREARNLHSDGEPTITDFGDYTRGQAELIAQATVLRHEDATSILEDVLAEILA